MKDEIIHICGKPKEVLESDTSPAINILLNLLSAWRVLWS